MTKPIACLGPPRLNNCDVMLARSSQEHFTGNETNMHYSFCLWRGFGCAAVLTRCHLRGLV